jgi:hypothetical protein
MSVRSVVGISLLVGLLLAGSAWSGSAAQEPNAPAPHAPNATKRLNAAKKVYESSWQLLQQQPDDAPDEVEHYYRWSVRWMQAERDLGRTHKAKEAAFEEHLKRMKFWKERRAMEREAGYVTAAEAAAAEFFFLEAEEWLISANNAEK